MSTNKQPFVYVIMLTHNGRNHLTYSLPSLFETNYPNFKVLLVDNASTDGASTFAQRNYPSTELIYNKRGLGWAGGNNVGARHALAKGADYLALVSDDLLFDPRWLSEGVKAAENDLLIGIVGFDLYDKKIHKSKQAFELAVERATAPGITETDNVRGAAMLVRRSVFENVGMIDEMYFAYADENDFERRVQRSGYRMVNVSIPIWHFSEGTWGRRPVLRSYLSIRNTVRYSIKNETVPHIFRTLFYILNVGCSPFYRIDAAGYVTQRFRPKGPIFNFGVIVICLLWNLVFLPQTLWQRRQDAVRIQQTKKLLANREGNIRRE